MAEVTNINCIEFIDGKIKKAQNFSENEKFKYGNVYNKNVKMDLLLAKLTVSNNTDKIVALKHNLSNFGNLKFTKNCLFYKTILCNEHVTFLLNDFLTNF